MRLTNVQEASLFCHHCHMDKQQQYPLGLILQILTHQLSILECNYKIFLNIKKKIRVLIIQ